MNLFTVIEKMLLPRDNDMHRAYPMARAALVELDAAGNALAIPGQVPSPAAIQRWMVARRRVQLQVTEVL